MFILPLQLRLLEKVPLASRVVSNCHQLEISAPGSSPPISHWDLTTAFGAKRMLAGRQSSLPRSKMTHSGHRRAKSCFTAQYSHRFEMSQGMHDAAAELSLSGSIASRSVIRR